jgi:DNA primase
MAASGERDDVRRVREATDIVAVVGQYVALMPGGENLKGLCPFHQDTKPSFTVSPAKQLYYCFGCNEGGDVFKFVMKTEGLDFAEALRRLAARAGITLAAGGRPRPADKKRDVLAAVVEDAAAFYYDTLRASDAYAEGARRYLRERGLTAETLDTWRVGLAPDSWDAFLRRATRAGFDPADLEAAGLTVPAKTGGGAYDRFRRRIVFPIWNAAGQAVAFGGRVLGDDEPKYLNSPTTPLYNKGETLYGFHRARAAISRAGRGLIVEGYLDLIGLFQVGVENAVATCGTALAPEAATALTRYVRDFILVYDGDDAGIRAARRAVAMLVPRGARVRVALPPPDKDPFDLAMVGPAAVAEVLAAATDWPDFLYAVARRESGGDETAARLATMREAGPLVAAIPDELERRFWRQRLAERVGVVPDTFDLAAPRPGAEAAATGPASYERTFLRLLVQNPALAGDALAEIELDDIADEQIRGILRVIGRLARGGSFGVVELLPELAEEDAAAVVSLAMSTERADDAETAAGLCTRAIKEGAFKRRARDVKDRLTHGDGGDDAHDDVRALIDEQRQLLRRRGKGGGPAGVTPA